VLISRSMKIITINVHSCHGCITHPDTLVCCLPEALTFSHALMHTEVLDDWTRQPHGPLCSVAMLPPTYNLLMMQSHI
jgi:hypothetical protein